MLVLIIAAIFGDLIGSVSAGAFRWLGYSKSFTNPEPSSTLMYSSYIRHFRASTFARFSVFAFFIYYKTAPKLIAGK